MYIGLWNPEVTIRHFVLKKQIFFLYFSIEMNVGNPNQTTKKKKEFQKDINQPFNHIRIHSKRDSKQCLQTTKPERT